jgi:hypothetical protein
MKTYTINHDQLLALLEAQEFLTIMLANYYLGLPHSADFIDKAEKASHKSYITGLNIEGIK